MAYKEHRQPEVKRTRLNSGLIPSSPRDLLHEEDPTQFKIVKVEGEPRQRVVMGNAGDHILGYKH